MAGILDGDWMAAGASLLGGLLGSALGGWAYGGFK